MVASYQFVKSDALDASKETPGLNVRNDSDIAKVQQEIETIKESAKNSSKIVNENGEPLVVYHGIEKGKYLIELDRITNPFSKKNFTFSDNKEYYVCTTVKNQKEKK